MNEKIQQNVAHSRSHVVSSEKSEGKQKKVKMIVRRLKQKGSRFKPFDAVKRVLPREGYHASLEQSLKIVAFLAGALQLRTPLF